MIFVPDREDRDEKLIVNGTQYDQCLAPAAVWTKGQIHWIILQTIVSTIISCSLNFGICTLSYRGNEAPTTFGWPSPMAGDYAVTIYLQTTLSFFVSCTLMTVDVLKGKVEPRAAYDVAWLPSNDSKYDWYADVCTLAIPSRDVSGNIESYCTRVKNHAIRSIPWLAFVGLALWPLFSGVSYLIWEKRGYGDFPLPEAITSFMGLLITIMTVPFWAVMILMRVGRKIQQDQPFI
jgi:hypothetical protein